MPDVFFAEANRRQSAQGRQSGDVHLLTHASGAWDFGPDFSVKF